MMILSKMAVTDLYSHCETNEDIMRKKQKYSEVSSELAKVGKLVNQKTIWRLFRQTPIV